MAPGEGPGVANGVDVELEASRLRMLGEGWQHTRKTRLLHSATVMRVRSGAPPPRLGVAGDPSSAKTQSQT